jgi:hypothetical protein
MIEIHTTLLTAESFRKYNQFHLLQSLTLAVKYNSKRQYGVGSRSPSETFTFHVIVMQIDEWFAKH